MFGIVGFEDHRIRCIIGVNPDERQNEQEILVDVQFEADFGSVARTDDLSGTACYASVADFCTQVAQKGKYQMLETLACELVRQLANRFQLSWIKVMIKKPSAIATASYAFAKLEYGTQKEKKCGV